MCSYVFAKHNVPILTPIKGIFSQVTETYIRQMETFFMIEC